MKDIMKYSLIPGLDIKPSCIGLGGEQLGGHGWSDLNETDLVIAVNEAIDFGVTLFDTAPIYGLGHSEEILGRTLGPRRKDVLIATKVGLKWEKGASFQKTTDSSPKRIIQEVEDSLERLNTDYIDLYQIHWPDHDTSVSDTMVAMAKLKKQGKIRAIGVCNFSLALLKEAMQYGQISTLQIPYNLLDREAEYELMPFCRRYGIAVIAYTPIAKGLLSGKYDGLTKFGSDDNRSRHPYFTEKALPQNLRIVEKVKTVAQRIGKTPAQVALHWALENSNITTALIGVKGLVQLKENIKATEFILSQSDLEYLNRQG